MKSFTARGIILSKKDFGEADRIFVIFTEKLGKVRFLAKGVRKIESRKRGFLEVFNNINFQAVSGRTFDLLLEVEAVSPGPLWKKDLRKVSVAYNFVEIVDRLTREKDPQEEIYDLLLSTLDSLAGRVDLRELREKFIVSILIYLGFTREGDALLEPEKTLELVLERRLSSSRVGKRVLS